MRVFRIGKSISWIGLACLAACAPAGAATWLETSLAGSSDNNIYSYVIPYTDSYSLMELKLSHKDKWARNTHYLGYYNFRGAAYNRWSGKNYLSNSVNLGLEQDLIADMVAGVSVLGTSYAYPDPTSAKYNYLTWETSANLRYYTFFWEFTSWELGAKYQVYTLPNYNFMQEGWTPSLTFQEEVAEYRGPGGYFNFKQGLPAALDFDLSVLFNLKTCPERPLYAGAQDKNFTGVYRQDQERCLNAGLAWRFLKNSNLRLGATYSLYASNANTLAYNAATGAVELEEGYYDRKNQGANLTGTYCYGRENSYLRVCASANACAYSGRKAQDAQGRLLSSLRSDLEYNVLLEINQRLGNWLGTNWLLRLGYNYLQNKSNDYYYTYTREVYTLGFVSNFYWE